MDSSTMSLRPAIKPPTVSSLVFTLIFILNLCINIANAEPVPLPFSSCAPSTVTEPNPLKRVNVTDVYGQIYVNNANPSSISLRLTALAEIGDTLEGYSNQTGYLATLFTSTNYLTYSIFDNTSSLCESLRPPSPLPTLAANVSNYCPVMAGPLAFGLTIPLSDASSLKTLVTQIRIVDSSSPAHELTCLEVAATPMYQDNYMIRGPWSGVFWGTVALTLSYWVVTSAGRISAAWDRGLGRSGNIWWMNIERTGFILASALSGEKFSVSPALLRFATPSARDLVLTTQWCAALGMIAVQWPDFAYPIFSNGAWSTLMTNTTITANGRDDHNAWSPLYGSTFNPPVAFSQQISDPASPLYLDHSQPNSLFTFPPDSQNGIVKFLTSMGVFPEHAFSICLSLFLMITAGMMAISGIIAIFGWTGSALSGKSTKSQSERKDATENDGRRTPFQIKRRFSLNSFHGSVTHGNLVRLLILFHLPITIYSSYHLTLDPSKAGVRSKVLAGLSFTFLSLLLPAWLTFRIATTSTSKLYEATRTLLALGPLYNQYQPKSQLFSGLFFAANVAIGSVIGFGQQSGTAQAVIILVIEVLNTLATSVWLPWMTGAQMGVISFMFCVARIVAAVLVVILAPPVNIGAQAGGWIAFGILSILGLMYLGFAFMLVIKFLEGITRLIRNVPFSSSRHSLDSGLFGALGCCGGSARRHKRRPRRAADARHSRGYSEATSRPDTSPTPYVQQANVSYLKPEQASIPYRESSDDDNGFIMESWSKTDLNLPGGIGGAGGAGARSKSKLGLEDATSITDGASSFTGFARVGGGRAHFDAPYAIAKGKQPLSPGRTNMNPAPISAYATGTAGAASVAQAHANLQPPIMPRPTAKAPETLPKGAARPIHSRTRSQTAVIEDASTVGPLVAGKAGSRPGSAGNTTAAGGASRPGSSGKSASHHSHGQRPSSSGKSPRRSFNSRPPSGVGIPRPPSRDMPPPRQALLMPDEMGAVAQVKSASTSKGNRRRWFRLGGSSAVDSSSDEDDEDEDEGEGYSRESSGRKRWRIKRRRKSESDMEPGGGGAAGSPPVPERSFVVVRNRPPHLGAHPAAASAAPPDAEVVERSEGSHRSHGMDPLGSPIMEQAHLHTTATELMSRTPLSPPENHEQPRAQSPPSSYNVPRNSRRMSSPAS